MLKGIKKKNKSLSLLERICRKTRPEQKVTSLMLREHLINLAKDVTEKEPLRNCKGSLVISWLGTGMARVLRMNSFEPMVG
jgi:hypothetical protein